MHGPCPSAEVQPRNKRRQNKPSIEALKFLVLIEHSMSSLTHNGTPNANSIGCCVSELRNVDQLQQDGLGQTTAVFFRHSIFACSKPTAASSALDTTSNYILHLSCSSSSHHRRSSLKIRICPSSCVKALHQKRNLHSWQDHYR